ncbi:MAG: hypothetical protein VZR24_12595 [Butyrivibrio hungatei]|nr:hypothetical protein [Butyrivibrio hungatei]
MQVEYTNSLVTWIYEGKKIECNIDGVEYAYANSKFVCVDSYTDSGFIHHYITFEGKNVCKYDDAGNLTILTQAGEQKQSIDKIDDIAIIGEKIYVMENGIHIQTYDFEAKNVGQIEPPNGYAFYRFLGEEKLEVVCQANPEYADSYGRVDFVFEYDFSHSSWTKKGLAY